MAFENIGLGSIFAVFAGLAVVMVIVFIALWVYMSWAFMVIGRKAKLNMPGLAWIPGIGPAIIAYQASKKHWWPWLLLIGIVIGFFVPVISTIAYILFAVMVIYWLWYMFEAIKKPGWWAILMIFPIVRLIVLGMAAWGKK